MNKKIRRIIKEFKVKDYSSFDEFYELTNRVVFYSFVPIVKSNDIAADIMQDVYMRFLDSIDSFKTGGNVYAYLSMIGRNLSINYYNREKRLIHSEELLQTIPSDEGVVYEYDSDILDLLYLLNKDQRVVVALHIINNLKFRVIAEIVEKPLGTVLWLYREAMKILRKELGEKDE